MTLEELDLSPEAVRKLTATCGRVREPQKEPRYLHGDEQKIVIARVRRDEPLIIALASVGVTAAAIGTNEGVSAECILKRLRPYGLAKRGRPRKER